VKKIELHSQPTFWGFSSMENFAISKVFNNEAILFNVDESLIFRKEDFSLTACNTFNLTPLNFEFLRPVFKKCKSEKIPIMVCTDVSSLIFLWFSRDDFDIDTKFYYKDERFIRSLENYQSVQSFIANDACDPWYDFDLTTRQVKIFKSLIRGASNKAIAEEIFQSEKTVEAEISKAAKKLGIETKFQNKENPRVMFGRKHAQILNII
jgi:DNA-binding CsgD family transcriptional regulator